MEAGRSVYENTSMKCSHPDSGFLHSRVRVQCVVSMDGSPEPAVSSRDEERGFGK